MDPIAVPWVQRRSWAPVALASIIAVILAFWSAPLPNAYAETFEVNDASDASDADLTNGFCDTFPGLPGRQCTLRAAIEQANASAGADLITFAAGPGVMVIRPRTALPTITSPAVIDGRTRCPGSSTPCVELDGSQASSGTPGLDVTAGGSTIRGLAINRFPINGDGIRLQGAGGNTVEGNFLGTDPSGTLALPNGRVGILIQNSPNNLIGGTTADRRNLISNSGFLSGIRVSGTGSVGNRILGNYVGTDVTGTVAMPNHIGIEIFNAPETVVGDGTTGGRNIISGNDATGIAVVNTAASDTRIAGNYIGADASGAPRLGNGGNGIGLISGPRVVSIGGTSPDEGNVIVANDGAGISIERSTGVIILSNVIRGNRRAGIHAFNDAKAVIRRNSILDNGALGIDLGGGPVDEGVTPNDPCDTDGGANDFMNFPVLTSVVVGDGATTIAGTLNSRAGRAYVVELFANLSADTSGHGEGATFLDSTEVTTDASCTASFSVTIPTALAPTQVVTATSSDGAVGTSELSAARGLDAADLAVAISGPSEPVSPGAVLRYDVTVANAGSGTASSPRLNIPVPAGTTFQAVTEPAGWTCDAPAVGTQGTVRCGAPRLPAGSVTFSLSALVPAGVPGGSTLSAAAMVDAVGPDPNGSNNSASAIIPVAAPQPPPPPGPSAGACAPRPPIQVRSAPDGNGRLRVTVAATEAPATPGNRLRELQLTATTNAVVEVNGGPVNLTGATSVPLPGRPETVELLVRRATPGQATTVQLVVVDDCGAWPTFVGGGPSAF